MVTVLAGTLAAAIVVAGLIFWLTDRRPAPSRRPAAAAGAAARAPRPASRPAAHLELSGRPAFAGSARPACTLHERSGLQVALRTGVAALPVVALQIDAFHGPGRYSGRLYVTARGRDGLVRSTGEGRLKVDARPLQDGRSALAGSYTGSYAGPAGSGRVRARFERCAYRAERPSPTAP